MPAATVQATVTSAGDLCTALRAALAFADDPDDGVLELAAVFLETSEGSLTVTGATRHHIGQARVTASGSLPRGAVIHVQRAAWLAAALDDLLVSDPVYLTIVESHLAPARLRVQHEKFAVELATVSDTWITYQAIFAAMDAEPESPGQILLQPRVVAPLAALADLYELPVRWTFFGPLKPIRVEVGGALLAAFMPAQPSEITDRFWPQAAEQG